MCATVLTMDSEHVHTKHSSEILHAACALVCVYMFIHTYRYVHDHEKSTRQESSPPKIAFMEGLREADVPLLLYQDSCVLQHPGGGVVAGTDSVNSQILKVEDQVLGVLPQWTTVQSAAASLQQQQCIKSL